jgi:hypothetical protein
LSESPLLYLPLSTCLKLQRKGQILTLYTNNTT